MPDYQIHGPGAFSYTPVLKQVAETRIKYGYGLESIEGYEILVAPSDCRLLGKSGWLIADKVYSIIIVDCEQQKHAGQMEARGILADVSKPDLGRGWLVIR